MKYISPFLVALLFSHTAQASELIYIPKNPNFGGNPLNASGLLANAQAQNKLKDPSSSSARPRTALERFAESIQSRAFSTLFSNAFNDGANGVLTTDDFTVILDNVDGVLTVTITDLNTGEVTEIVIGGAAGGG
tara:strand:- start:1682 stop:2083 length:402 start_codon:yes stop_codon:yes gene_type:complete